MPPTTPIGSPDLGRLLGLTGIGAQVLVALYWLTFLSLAIFSGGEPMRTAEGWVALALVLSSSVLLILPWRYPLPIPLVGILLVITAFTTVAICWHLDPIVWPGYTSWNFGAVTFLMYMVALRGRVAAATVGMLLMAALTIHWTVSTSGDWSHGLLLVYRQFFSFVAVALFAVWLRRTAKRIAAFRAAQQSRAAEEQATVAAADERSQQLGRVRAIAGPALHDIASGRLDAAQREEHRLIEADLRDSIRGRALARGELPAAARAARRRGVTVAIIDDLRVEVSAAALAPAIAWASARLSRVPAGEATVRLANAGGEALVTFATADGQTATFIQDPDES
jgi:transposase-like protein